MEYSIFGFDMFIYVFFMWFKDFFFPFKVREGSEGFLKVLFNPFLHCNVEIYKNRILSICHLYNSLLLLYFIELRATKTQHCVVIDVLVLRLLRIKNNFTVFLLEKIFTCCYKAHWRIQYTNYWHKDQNTQPIIQQQYLETYF